MDIYTIENKYGSLIIDSGQKPTIGLQAFAEYFTIVHGKYLQSAIKISEHLNKLISRRLGKDSHVFHINPQQQGNSFRMGKKVTGKLYNLDDAVYWTSYIAKVATKFSPFMQKSFSCSKGFMDGATPEIKYMLQLTKSNAEWFAWGGSHLNWGKILNFNPAIGKPFDAERVPENCFSCTEAFSPYLRMGETQYDFPVYGKYLCDRIEHL